MPFPTVIYFWLNFHLDICLLLKVLNIDEVTYVIAIFFMVENAAFIHATTDIDINKSGVEINK